MVKVLAIILILISGSTWAAPPLVGIYTTIGVDASSCVSLLAPISETYSEELISGYVAAIASAGFDFFISYTTPYYATGDRVTAQVSLLDLANNHGIKVYLNIYYLAHASLSNLCSDMPTLSAELAATIAAVKDHPALLGYYIFDEPRTTSANASCLESMYQQIKSADPSHSVLWVDPNKLSVATYSGAADLIGSSIYPINSEIALTTYYTQIDEFESETSAAGKSFWNAVQASRISKATTPTAQEINRIISVSSLSNANGLIFFSFDYPDGPLPTVDSAFWATVGQSVSDAKNNAIEIFVNDITLANFRSSRLLITGSGANLSRGYLGQ